ncbi:putative lipid-transfer protein Ltp1 [Streptomyces virginiae]|uniref:propanoyl-CoA C-acyltransferase n=1 Tax=Streptomyces virginiae TaxID=1961 RepID=A0ABQ3NZS9_STRVG|nr:MULTISPECIES: lipid-transfer protein [Streptomyces]GLV90806.1 putative lipid-transfer protein Ltp1 [Streptomyces lavendulae subsp. lavendulae]KOU91227.1 Nonspecific lipid-transfer protein [Streptomyces sp. XY533]MBP2343886.1 acetyl-CoA acetyltransferase [Streptomyces virginiae]GGQ11570.1 putative lipid-transfer protein Ltp1 [Streptomyces virginiae]GHI18278.1 putative lipid-transfer protein Ltp1 [Streptomyces virginiae]
MKSYIVGVGMTKFEKPESRDWQYWDMAKEAGSAALADAGVDYGLVQQVPVGYCFQASTAGQRAAYELGLSGVPVYNVNNNCATGSTALMMARQFVEGGLSDCVLALGFEKMKRGALGGGADGGARGGAADESFKTSPVARHYGIMAAGHGFEMSPPTAQIFGNAAREHMERYGTTQAQLAAVGAKNHRHSADNPNAQFQDVYSVEEILAAKEIHAPLTKLQCSPTSDGAAAALVVSERFLVAHGLHDKAVEIVAQAMTTDTEASFASGSCIDVVGKPMTAAAARQVYESSGLGIEDVDVVELHDCFSINELLTYEALGMCEDGAAGKLVESGATTYGGRWVVNPSGGLISKGHPLGATGLAQAAELVWQLRGAAGPRQVPGARVGLAHNIGLGGAAVVTLLRR